MAKNIIIIGILLFAILVMVLISFIGIYNIKTITSSQSEVYDKNITPFSAMGEVATTIQQNKAILLQISNDQDVAIRHKRAGLIKELDKLMYEDMLNFERTDLVPIN